MLPLGAAWGTLAEGIAEGILAVDACGLVLAHNRRLHDLWELGAPIPVGSSLSTVAALFAERLVDREGFAGSWLAANAPGPERSLVFKLKGGRVLEGRLAPVLQLSGAAVRVWSFRDVTERERALVEAAEEHRQARSDLADRERMVTVAAHELRSPLASLRIAVGALRRKAIEGPRQARLLEVIERDERRLTRMIGELLDLGRIRSGQLELELDAVDLIELVHEVVARMAPDIARSGSSVTVHAGPGDLVGRWDRARLDQVVTNLIGNAVKYGAGRPIEITVEIDPGVACDPGTAVPRARMTVTDQGRGIDPQVHRQIFEPFARAPGVRESSGLGLGLYIVQTIVCRLGGEVRVDSAPGRGSAFTVALPLHEPASQPAGVEASVNP